MYKYNHEMSSSQIYKNQTCHCVALLNLKFIMNLINHIIVVIHELKINNKFNTSYLVNESNVNLFTPIDVYFIIMTKKTQFRT